MITYPHLKQFLQKAPKLEEVREALRGLKGELSAAVIEEREEEWR